MRSLVCALGAFAIPSLFLSFHPDMVLQRLRLTSVKIISSRSNLLLERVT